jgi:chitinase
MKATSGICIVPLWTSLLLVSHCHISIADPSACSAASPCANGACCSEWGSCGYGPDFCGEKCLSNCDAKAECGNHGIQETCPLNVCCSQFGFCGTTEDFCLDEKKCQNNCGTVELPTCSTNDEMPLLDELITCFDRSSYLRVSIVEIGYYASWCRQRSCNPYTTQNIDPHKYTHLIYAFGQISEGIMIDPETAEEMSEMIQFTKLKDVNSSLKVLISVGGWAFNDPGPTQQEFHNIISTQGRTIRHDRTVHQFDSSILEGRVKFITSVQNYLQKYGFDGIDIDYEYPTAEDRGGSPDDTENFLQLVREMRDALGENYLITIAAPASFWYLRHFKIGDMSEYLDFINVMTYDIHGTWDSDIPSLGPYVKSHASIEEIQEALKLFLRGKHLFTISVKQSSSQEQSMLFRILL